jgi:hypothetical protein
MRVVVGFLVLLTCLPVYSQSNNAEPPRTAGTCPDRSEMQEELTQTKALVARMQNRVITMRNSAGTVRDFDVKNALQVNADAWQDLVDDLKQQVERLQTRADRCEARQKIESAKPK